MSVGKILVMVGGFLLGCALAWGLIVWMRPPEVRWTMINVTPNDTQADCHLIEFPDGSKVLIDAAEAADAPGTALKFLRSKRVKHLQLVVISHFHADHYGQLLNLIDAGIRIDRVAINLPASREIADVERPWGCDWDDVQRVLGVLKERGIPFFTPKAGERLIEVKSEDVVSALDVVCLYDGFNTPVGRTDMNDTSILIRLTHGSTRALFTGDLNRRLGAWLATSDFDLKADILKVPHHGTEGVAPNEFFSRVNPTAALVPAPQGLWLSARSKRIRDYFMEKKVPTYVTGIHGHTTVRMTDRGYKVSTQRKAKDIAAR